MTATIVGVVGDTTTNKVTRVVHPDDNNGLQNHPLRGTEKMNTVALSTYNSSTMSQVAASLGLTT